MKKLLIIDDDKGVLEMAGSHFRSQGFEVLCAGTANEGLRLAFKDRPHAILLDYNLDEYTGEDVLERVKKCLPGSKVLMVTGALDPALERRLLALGADAFLLKGSSIISIQRKVEELTG